MSDEYEFAIVGGTFSPAKVGIADATTRSSPAGEAARNNSIPAPAPDVPGEAASADDSGELAPALPERKQKKLTKKRFEKEFDAFRSDWKAIEKTVEAKALKVVVLVEGRDAGKDRGIVARIAEFADPRICRVARVEAPGARERSQWFFQPYVAYLPAAGEMALFDGSWYARAGLGRATATFSDDEYADVLRACADFERVLVHSGILVLKYWLTVEGEKGEFADQLATLGKRWTKDLGADVDYEKIREQIFALTDVSEVPWRTVTGGGKREVRLRFLGAFASVFAGDADGTGEEDTRAVEAPNPPVTDRAELAEA